VYEQTLTSKVVRGRENDMNLINWLICLTVSTLTSARLPTSEFNGYDCYDCKIES